MGRAPCCEKMGLNRGPWTRDEDQLLINYINENGHGNWRALPKKAGLLRCGKSCRLRWTNYLRPDIIRGNFSKEDEDAIIELHKELGNKWSAIAARLPGRTDNEIKNVWHTHLKKKLNPPPETVKRIRKRTKTNPESKKDTKTHKAAEITHEPVDSSTMQEDSNTESKDEEEPNSPSSENSSTVTTATTNDATNGSTTTTTTTIMSDVEKFLDVDEDFWSDVISGDYSSITSCDLPGVNSEPRVQSWSSPIQSTVDVCDFHPNTHHDDMEFWYNIFTRDGEIQDLLEL